MTELIKIPLFPLGLVLLPNMHLPLHIFEDRYKEMIGVCLADDIPFGIVLFDGQSIRAVGCMARITKVLKRYDDGRMDIMTRGGERFVIRELIQERAYMEAQVYFFDDTGGEVDHERTDDLVKSALKLLKEAYGNDIGLAPADLSGPLDPQALGYAIAALEGFEPAERQEFLEMTVSAERLEKCVQALARILSRNRLTREIRYLISGNGNPPQRILKQLQDHLDK